MSAAIPPFTPFVRDLGVRLDPAQRVLCRVAYDGVDPVDLPARDRDLAGQIFGDVEEIPSEARDVFVAVCGARSGKSYIFGALRLLHLALTVSLDTLAPGELAAGLFVGPDTRLAAQGLRYAIGAARSTKSIASRIVAETDRSLTIRREGGRAVQLQCLPATRGGSAVRGRSLIGAVLDEFAFFRDRDYLVNDEEVFRAIAPRILPDGQLVVASTPWAEAGMLYELYSQNHGTPTIALAAHAPTALMRSDRRIHAMVERERKRDPDNAAREFDARFMTGGSGLFLDAAAVDACIDPELLIPAQARAA